MVADQLREYALTHAVTPAPRIDSCGLHAEPGQPLLDSIRRGLRSRKRHVPEHRSRPFRLSDLRSARLVITFEEEQRRAVVSQKPSLVPRTFTLREIVRLSSSPLWQEEWNGTRDVAARLHALRPLVEAGDDNTPDPANSRRWGAMKVLDGLLADVAKAAPVLLAPSAPSAHRAPEAPGPETDQSVGESPP